MMLHPPALRTGGGAVEVYAHPDCAAAAAVAAAAEARSPGQPARRDLPNAPARRRGFCGQPAFVIADTGRKKVLAKVSP